MNELRARGRERWKGLAIRSSRRGWVGSGRASAPCCLASLAVSFFEPGNTTLAIFLTGSAGAGAGWQRLRTLDAAAPSPSGEAGAGSNLDSSRRPPSAPPRATKPVFRALEQKAGSSRLLALSPAGTSRGGRARLEAARAREGSASVRRE